MKEHIKQNDERLLTAIREIGCFFRCCGIIAENATGKSLLPGQINSVWLWALENGHIDGEHNIRASAPIATKFLQTLGESGRKFVEVGTFADGRTQFYPGVSPGLRRIDALIQKYTQSGPSKYHFIVVDKEGRTVEDPHDPPIKKKCVLYSILYALTEA